MSDNEKNERRHDCVSNEDENKKYTRLHLIKQIEDKSNGLTKVKGSLKDSQSIATKMYIPILYTSKKKIEGWEGKQKGCLQILWERGFINPQMTKQEVVRYYSMNGKKDNDGNIIVGSNLREIIADLPDFKTEKTLLQYRAEELGVAIDCSPKYHPEIAGEGIEFCWGASKNQYRLYSMKEKKKKENWMGLVRKCTCNQTVLNKQSVLGMMLLIHKFK
jgi:hypothetical protein